MTKKKILITGSNGLLGQKLVYKLMHHPALELIATARGDNRLVNKEGYIYETLDITNKEQTQSVITQYLPEIIINTAAMTNVDACESDREGAYAMNTAAVNYQVETLEHLQQMHPGYQSTLHSS
jgi:dTDP-4-dehydrorhamnose reductase